MDKTKTTCNSLLNNLLFFIKKPYYSDGLEQIIKKRKLWNIFRLWSLAIVVILAVGWLIMYLIEASGYDITNNAIVEFYDTEPILIIILFALFWGPISEEITFRLGLKYSPFRLSFSLAFLLFFIINIFIYYFEKQWVNILSIFHISNPYFTTIFNIGLVVFVGISLGYYLRRKGNTKKIKEFYSKHFGKIFYSSIAIFAIVHLLNYYDVGQIWYLAIILVIPQFLVAVILGYVRVRYGFIWSVITHFMHNGLLSLPQLMLSYLSEETILALESSSEMIVEDIASKDVLIIFATVIITVVILVSIVISIISLFRENIKYKNAKIK